MPIQDAARRNAAHATFTLERTYPASPARVFKAFADRKAKAKWFQAPAGNVEEECRFDFRVDGQEVVIGRHANGVVSGYYAVYQDIVPDERIVYAYRMTLDGVPISATLATIELTPRGAGTHLSLTEYGVFFDGYDGAASREEGTNWLLDKVGQSLAD
jgi:uncharacterized protein YndB with AHSA1/START domain